MKPPKCRQLLIVQRERYSSRRRSCRENNRHISSSRLQRQCIAALSSLASNSTSPIMRPARRDAVERALLFLASFHWQKSVRGEATLALRRSGNSCLFWQCSLPITALYRFYINMYQVVYKVLVVPLHRNITSLFRLIVNQNGLCIAGQSGDVLLVGDRGLTP